MQFFGQGFNFLSVVPPFGKEMREILIGRVINSFNQNLEKNKYFNYLSYGGLVQPKPRR